MEYRFTDTEERPPRVIIETDLIPNALKRAQQVKPRGRVLREMWQGAIYRNENNPDPKFSWYNFLKSLAPSFHGETKWDGTLLVN